MTNENDFLKQPEAIKIESSFEHSGAINLTAEESSILDRESKEAFSKHPAFAGVEIRQIDFEKIPADILKIIKESKGNVTAFTAVRIAKEVPLHQHIADSEIYFGGSNGTVTLLDPSKNEIGKFALSNDSFTSATTGEWHGVTSQAEEGSTFFGVKFTK
jgi:hypothetical protein